MRPVSTHCRIFTSWWRPGNAGNFEEDLLKLRVRKSEDNVGSLGFTDGELHNAVSGTQSMIFRDLSPGLVMSVETLMKAISNV